ncbi:unnamed protein product [Amaranthus hypochondriacus]
MAESNVASAVQWIGSILIQEASSLFHVADQVRGLQQELELMQQYLKDADTKQESGEIHTLLRHIRKLAYDAEDVIDNYIVNIQAKSEESYRNFIMKMACFMYSAPKNYEIGKLIQETQDKVKEKIEELNKSGLRRIPALLEDYRHPRRRMPQRRSYYYDDNFDYVVGLENDMQKLMLEVLIGEGSTHLKVLAIVGMGGCGKTTLARKLYNHPSIKKCFMNCMAWVSISQEWDTSHVLSEILRKVGGPRETSELHAKLNVGELMDKLYSILKEKLYLVILDDVWRQEALEQILPALPWGSMNSRSKIIITTRNRKIITGQNFQKHLYIHEPQPLSEDEGWDLLSKLALSHHRNCSIESFERLGKEMLKKCSGLPLAIVALAGILNTREGIGEWQLVSDTVRSRVMEGTSTSTDTCTSVQDLLSLSYEDLPYDLKPCFLYLGVFPEDCRIAAGMLTRMWIAEGLVVAHGEMCPEDVAVQCLEDLSHRFMIQVVRTNYKGAIKVLHLHDLLRDLCLKKAKEESFLQVYPCIRDQATTNASMLHIQPRRAAFHSSIIFPTHVSNLRSLILLTRSSTLQNTYVSKNLDSGIVHHNIKLLRLLNLWGIKIPSGTLPAQIGNLIHLRYLGFRASNIVKLPTSIGNLRNLLTLDYRNIDFDNNVPVQLPNIFGKLALLRHLYLPVDSPWKLKELQLSSMPNLQVLWGVKCSGEHDWFSREVPKLSSGLKKLKVVVTTEKDLKAAFNCPSLTSGQLHTFHCEWSGVALRLANPIFSHNQHLHKLVLVGKLQVNRLSFVLPSNLVVLELKDSIIELEDPMVAIGALTHLKLLKLSNSYSGTSFVCNYSSFPVLEELYLANLPKLNVWEVQSGALPCIKKLVIIKCGKLHMFPLGLPFVATLQQLECFGVPQEFVQKAEECGWSRQILKLPHNFEAIIEQSDIPVDFFSVSKLYEQLSVGVFLNNKTQKYWVVKQNDRYYNCFMFYATYLHLTECDPFTLHSLDNCWEWTLIEESEGVLITVGKIKPRAFSDKFFYVEGDFDAGNLSPEITYEITFVIKFPLTASQRCLRGVRSYFSYASGNTNAQELNLHDKPRDEWIRLAIGEFMTSPASAEQTLIFRLAGIEPGFEIQGVVIEPKTVKT